MRDIKIVSMSNIENCTIINIPIEYSNRGTLSFIESSNQVPFDIKRVYFTYDIPSNAERGGHAHKNLQQIIIAASGSFNVIVDDGRKRKSIYLDSPSKGLLITPGIWREINQFSNESIVLVLASELFNIDDYIWNYDEFTKKTS